MFGGLWKLLFNKDRVLTTENWCRKGAFVYTDNRLASNYRSQYLEDGSFVGVTNSLFFHHTCHNTCHNTCHSLYQWCFSKLSNYSSQTVLWNILALYYIKSTIKEINPRKNFWKTLENWDNFEKVSDCKKRGSNRRYAA